MITAILQRNPFGDPVRELVERGEITECYHKELHVGLIALPIPRRGRALAQDPQQGQGLPPRAREGLAQ